MSNIPVVIFCGGKGTRMRGGTLTKKELVPIGGQPIIWHVMRIFSAHGFNRFVLPLGYEANQIRRYFYEYERMNRDVTIKMGGDNAGIIHHNNSAHSPWQISLVDTGVDTSKPNRLAQIADYLDGDKFFVTYGDGVSDIDLKALHQYHEQHGKLGTITAVQAHYQYGILDANDHDLVTAYHLKPKLPYWINAGFMLFNREALPALTTTSPHDSDPDIFVDLLAKGELMRYRHHSFWHSMDTLKDQQVLEKIWQQDAPWKIW